MNNGGGGVAELTEALTAYQAAVSTAEDKAEAIGEFLEVENYDPANNEANVTAAENAVLAEQADLDGAVATRSNARDTDLTGDTRSVPGLSDDTDYAAELTGLQNITGIETTTKLSAANVTKAINNALADVKADETSKERYDLWVKAQNDLASDRATNGSDEAVAKALNDAIVAYLQAGGDDSGDEDLADIRAAFAAEEVKGEPDWTNVIDAAAAAFVVDTTADPVTVQLANGGTASELSAVSGDLTKAIVDTLKDAAVVADDRQLLIEDVDATVDGTAADNFLVDDAKGALYQLALDLQQDFAALDKAVVEATEERDQAQSDLDALKALVAEYDAADAEVDEAFAALEEQGVESLVEIEDAGNYGVADEAELFLFSPSKALQTASVELEAEDRIFLGDAYTLNTEADLSENEGDSSTLEIFLTQDGVNTLLSIEQSAFGSNAANQELHEITLVGVSVEDVSFEGGYITVA